MLPKDLLTRIDNKKDLLEAFQPLPPEFIKNLYEWFRVELTYTSNAIEGNTLSRAETALIVEKGITVEGKSLEEHLEAVNHGEAFNLILEKSKIKRNKITANTILEIHQKILQKIDETNAGRYRNVPVRIAGSTVIMPNPMKVPNLMDEFIAWLQNAKGHPIQIAAEAHFKLVSIYPFVDGNGRTARLLMNLLLLQAGYPPAVIRKEDRHKYISSIEKAQLDKNNEEALDDYLNIIYKSVERSLDMYIGMLTGKEGENTEEDFLKIGELANLSGETVPTIRHWTEKGLLKVVDYTQGGYQLYEKSSLEVVKKIRELQNTKRLTLEEIKERIF